MKNFKGEIIIKPIKNDNGTLVEIGNSIHRQLVDNQDYINSNIVLCLRSDSIQIFIDDCKGEVPNIVF